MSKKTLAAGTSPFAHLLSGFRGKKAEDDDKTKGKRAEDETPVDEDGPTNEDDAIDDTEVDDVEDEPADEDRAKKGKKAKGRKAKADDDVDDDEDQDPEADADDDDAEAEEGMDDKEAKAFRRGLAAGRKRENVRASRIFSAAASASRPDLAATLAFTTRNTSAEAGRLMSVAGANPARRLALDDRMGRRTEPRPGAGGAPASGKPSLAQRLAAARTKAGRD